MARTLSFHGETLTMRVANYATGATAVILLDADGAPYATLSVALPESADLPHGTFYLKDYSENEAIAKAAIDAGLIEPANPFLYPPVRSGFVTVSAYSLA